MKQIAIFYGSSSGTTEDIAGRIAGKLGVDGSNIYDVANAKAADTASYDVLLLGSSTWGFGDLQDDWESFLPQLKKTDLSGKTVALFGTGDSSSYSDTFCDAIGIIYRELQGTGCTFCGAILTNGYTFDESVAIVNGEFVGLPLDEVNEDDETDSRINGWVELLISECLN